MLDLARSHRPICYVWCARPSKVPQTYFLYLFCILQLLYVFGCFLLRGYLMFSWSLRTLWSIGYFLFEYQPMYFYAYLFKTDPQHESTFWYGLLRLSLCMPSPGRISDRARASLRFTKHFFTLAVTIFPPQSSVLIILLYVYSGQSSVWFFAIRWRLSDLSS